jgi:hypothetical protein
MARTAGQPTPARVRKTGLVTELTWRWVFYVNVPIGILALCVGAIFLDEHREANAGRLDAAGFVLSGAGFDSSTTGTAASAGLIWPISSRTCCACAPTG